jgi:hypothetical protein
VRPWRATDLHGTFLGCCTASAQIVHVVSTYLVPNVTVSKHATRVTQGTLTPSINVDEKVVITPSLSMRVEGGTVKTVNSIATSVAALAAIGGAAAGMASIALPSGLAQVQLAAVGAPLPQNPPPAPAPGANIPTAGQLTGLLNSLVDPTVPFANKGNMVEGGISGTQAHIADRRLKKAAENGDLPLTFNITNIQPGAPGSATADVAVSGPKLPNPVTQNVTFVNQGSWMLSRASAIQAIQLLQATGH